MAAMPNPNPEEKGKKGDGVIPTPPIPDKGTEGDQTLKKEPKDEQLPSEPVDYKKKFSESTREVQRIQEEAKLDKERIAKLEAELKSNPPSEKELVGKYPDWNFLDEGEKERLRINEERDKRLRKLEEKLAWEDDWKSLVNKPEFASLKDKEDEFKDYAYEHPEVKDLSLLAKSYLFENKEPEIPPERKGLEKATGGEGKISTGEEMSLEDITRLRTEDPKLYSQMIRERRIKKIPEK